MSTEYVGDGMFSWYLCPSRPFPSMYVYIYIVSNML